PSSDAMRSRKSEITRSRAAVIVHGSLQGRVGGRHHVEQMRMFPFCSDAIKESSDRMDGNIFLNIRNQQNTHENQPNSGRRIFYRAFASANPFV
ncbi:hypothetical protein, partial [Rhizobium laguerreae]|uniref:hypothetical protein n=1 Tax=Rhizobium laguerreae TaxID=1076926 RepID=UPI001C92A31E